MAPSSQSTTNKGKGKQPDKTSSTVSTPHAAKSGSHGTADKHSMLPSSNWLALQKRLPKPTKSQAKPSKWTLEPNLKHRPSTAPDGMVGKGSHMRACASSLDFVRENVTISSSTAATSPPIAGPSKSNTPHTVSPGVAFVDPPNETPLVRELRGMVAGLNPMTDAKRIPGSYLAIDCEMVGLGHLGAESCLARVSIVNYHGHVILDEFVRPRERVTDWRTWVSGVRPEDMESAREFMDVQRDVAKLVEGRILIGHAIQNDTQALLLSHPAPLTRDTQTFSKLREAAKTKKPGLKKLTEILLGVKIQAGGHSSVTDARATMALYRLFKSEWESMVHRQTEAYAARTKSRPLSTHHGKRKAATLEDDLDDEANGPSRSGGKKRKQEQSGFPGGGRKGVSSGLSVIIRKNGVRIDPPGHARASRAGEVAAAASTDAGNWWE